MDIDPRRLAILLAVHRSGGVLAAADTLRLTPSAVSQQIARLEAETGIQVLDRNPGGATLTGAGRVLADSGERIESELADARRSLAALSGDVSGTVVVGAFQTVLRAILVPLVARIGETMPGLEVILREVSTADGQRALRTGDLDVLVIEHDAGHDPPVPRGMRDVPFLDEPWHALLPANLPVPETLLDMAGHTWLGVSPGSAAARAVERVTTALGIRPVMAHRYADFDVAISLAAAGLGIALVPSLAVDRSMPEVQVAAVPGLGSRRLVVRHRTTRHEPRAAVTAVLEEIITQAGELDLSADA